MSEEEEVDSESYKHLAQFHHIVQRNEHTEDRCEDKERLLWELKTVIEQPGNNINYQFPNTDHVRSSIPRLVGCTALHLVSTQQCFWLSDVGQRYQDNIEFLLSRGIDVTLKNHRGSTALHCVVDIYYREYYSHYRVRGKLKNSTVNMLLSAHVERDVVGNPRDKNGLSHFHIACMANHSAAVEFFLSKAGVSVNEVFDGDFLDYRGCTPLHFAARCCTFKVAEILMKYGADVNIKNARGMTPMDLLLEENVTMVDLINTVDNPDSSHYYRLPRLMKCLDNNKKIVKLLVLHEDSLKFYDTGLTRFHVACTLDDISLVEKLLTDVEDINHCVKMDSPFWPDYTALHFAAHSNIKAVKFLLDHGANAEAKDANGLSPFDICVERYKVEDLHYILQSNAVWKDILMSDNKTKLLDVVIAMKDSETLNEFLNESSKASLRVPNDSPLWPGYTLLHLAINFAETVKIITDYERQWYFGKEDFEKLHSEYFKRIEVCFTHGADVDVQDARGQTVLHLAYRIRKAKVVKLLLDDEARISNSVDEDNLSHLYIACAFDYPQLVKKLLTNDNSHANLQIKPTYHWQRSCFARADNGEHRFFVTTGSTPLHVAGTTELISMLLEHGADVNVKDASGVTLMQRALASEHDDCRQMDSRTSMNVLALGCRYQLSKDKIVGLLMDNGAEAASSKTEESSSSRRTTEERSTSRKEDTDLIYFRAACEACNLDTMEDYLKRGVDVNRPGNLLARDFPGYRPIHHVLHPYSNVDCARRIEALDLLLRYGVDVNGGDLFDNNAFHVATLINYGAKRIKIFQKILSMGTDIKRRNVFGEELFGMLLCSRRFEMEDIDFILQHNPLGVNIFEPVRGSGCMPICFSKNFAMFKKIIRSPSITKIDDFGRNAIHNVVCPEYSWGVDYTIAIRRLMERGCDINHRDHLGRTPLQLALQFNHSHAVTRLLEAGADVNITDAKGYSAFADVEEWHGNFEPMAMHIRRLQMTGLYVSELNVKILDEHLKTLTLDESKIERAKADLKKMKDAKIRSTSLSPYDFFSETGAVAAFPYMPLSEQQAVNDYFKYMRTYHFKQLGCLMKLRHKEALKRVTLVEPARLKLNILLKCKLPAKCSRRVLRFLTNRDLENIIAV